MKGYRCLDLLLEEKSDTAPAYAGQFGRIEVGYAAKHKIKPDKGK